MSFVLGRFARHLGDDVAGRDGLPLEHVQVRPDRQEVTGPRRCRYELSGPRVLDRDARALVDVLRVDG